MLVSSSVWNVRCESKDTDHVFDIRSIGATLCGTPVGYCSVSSLSSLSSSTVGDRLSPQKFEFVLMPMALLSGIGFGCGIVATIAQGDTSKESNIQLMLTSGEINDAAMIATSIFNVLLTLIAGACLSLLL